MGIKEGGMSLLNAIMPKKNVILFNSYPDVGGNALALYEYILKNRPDVCRQYRLVWTVASDAERFRSILHKRTGIDGHDVREKKSSGGIFAFLTAKYIFSTHGYFSAVRFAKGQTHVNLWHGMPFKKIGKDVGHDNGKQDKADCTIATGELFREIMAYSFDIDREKVLVSGQPCNDLLLKKGDFLAKLGIDRDAYRKVIMWMPTYRKSVVGDIRSDGNENGFGVCTVLQTKGAELNALLREKGYLLIVKPHPMDAVCQMELSGGDNVLILKNERLDEENLQLYEVLSECDVLLTDYSSVYIDYMITDRPIAFVCDDLEEYERTRGFSVENPREYMPGELISDTEGLFAYLSDMEETNGRWREKYGELRSLFHTFPDGESSARVCEAFFGQKNS